MTDSSSALCAALLETETYEIVRAMRHTLKYSTHMLLIYDGVKVEINARKALDILNATSLVSFHILKMVTHHFVFFFLPFPARGARSLDFLFTTSSVHPIV